MGVIMVACFTTIAISFMPPRAVRRVFPPMISGITIFCELRLQAACNLEWLCCTAVLDAHVVNCQHELPGPRHQTERCYIAALQ